MFTPVSVVTENIRENGGNIMNRIDLKSAQFDVSYRDVQGLNYKQSMPHY